MCVVWEENKKNDNIIILIIRTSLTISGITVHFSLLQITGFYINHSSEEEKEEM